MVLTMFHFLFVSSCLELMILMGFMLETHGWALNPFLQGPYGVDLSVWTLSFRPCRLDLSFDCL